ncbi:hypothetical protein C8F04DRAFT_1197904 [Mycena alexandri]|uniref:Uncharacterized protein n=1 Tax=Mycena alexandri TaxID=1745969 RepID=A0AAD6S2V5_9AGAR|nr:hypothetical protein C8F04DRAFT_1197904 [Mycena alexandri]
MDYKFVSRWTFLANARPRWCLLRAHLPTEIWTLILLECCRSSRPGGFSAERDYLCSVYEELGCFITGVAVFWTEVQVDLSTGVESLVLAVASARALALHINVDLRSDLEEWDICPDQMDLLQCLDVLKSVSTKWRSVCCRVNRELYLELARNFLGGSLAPQLTRLDIQSTVADLQPDIGVFKGVLPNLRQLKVVTFPIAWVRNATFGRLTNLELRNVSPLHFPSVYLFASLLKGLSTTLRSLILVGVGLTGDSLDHQAPFSMRFLEILGLAFVYGFSAQDSQLTSMLAGIEVPCLRSLKIENSGDENVAHLTSALPFLRNLSNLVVSGGFMGKASVEGLLGAVPGLNALDVHMASYEFIEALAALPELLHKLSTLRFAAPDASSFLSYLLGRNTLGFSPVGNLHLVEYPDRPLSPLQIVATYSYGLSLSRVLAVVMQLNSTGGETVRMLCDCVTATHEVRSNGIMAVIQVQAALQRTTIVDESHCQQPDLPANAERNLRQRNPTAKEA